MRSTTERSWSCATPPVSVPTLLAMGFSWGQVHHALEATGDLHLAQEMLLQQRAALMIPGPD